MKCFRIKWFHHKHSFIKINQFNICLFLYQDLVSLQSSCFIVLSMRVQVWTTYLINSKALRLKCPKWSYCSILKRGNYDRSYLLSRLYLRPCLISSPCWPWTLCISVDDFELTILLLPDSKLRVTGTYDHTLLSLYLLPLATWWFTLILNFTGFKNSYGTVETHLWVCLVAFPKTSGSEGFDQIPGLILW